MAKRKIVKIDEQKCTGCGECIPNCEEGALRIVDGKARLVKDIYCDGLGACLGHCPEGAITIEEREAEQFDEEATKKHSEDIKKKEEKKLPCGCPGTAVRSFKRHGTRDLPTGRQASDRENLKTKSGSELGNWPVQLMLVPVSAPFLKNSDLLIAADCVSFAYAGFHGELLEGKSLVIGCPKLDAATIYEEKLAGIIKQNNIKTITVAHMEVPCCFGLNQIVREAIRLSGREVPVKEVTIGIKGEVK